MSLLGRSVLFVASLALAACGGDADEREGADAAETGRSGGRADGGAPGDTAEDAPIDVADADEPEDTGPRPDTIVDDGFTRPPPRDTDPEDAPSDTAADAGPDSARDAAVDAAADTPDPPDPHVFTGEQECFRWTIEAEQVVLDFKVDDFLVSYLVQNICVRDLTFRVDHFNDFFSLALHKDGELWTYLGVCPGEGPSHEWTFHAFSGGTAEGVRRAWRWSADQHETLLAACGVVFDEDATYTLVGYGNVPLEGSTTRSEQFVLTDEIPITINP